MLVLYYAIVVIFILAYDIYKTDENYNESKNTAPKTISAFKNGTRYLRVYKHEYSSRVTKCKYFVWYTLSTIIFC
jgi:hypothetical protein